MLKLNSFPQLLQGLLQSEFQVSWLIKSLSHHWQWEDRKDMTDGHRLPRGRRLMCTSWMRFIEAFSWEGVGL